MSAADDTTIAEAPDLEPPGVQLAAPWGTAAADPRAELEAAIALVEAAPGFQPTLDPHHEDELYLGLGIDQARCAACAAYPVLPCAVHRPA